MWLLLSYVQVVVLQTNFWLSAHPAETNKQTNKQKNKTKHNKTNKKTVYLSPYNSTYSTIHSWQTGMLVGHKNNPFYSALYMNIYIQQLPKEAFGLL